MGSRRKPPDRVVFATARWEGLLYGGAPVFVVTGLAWTLQYAARLLALVPMEGVATASRTVARVPLPEIGFWLGAALGLITFVAVNSERVSITVTPQAISFGRPDPGPPVERDRITAAFFEEQYLVLLGADGEEVARGQYDANRFHSLRAALLGYEYPVLPGRPPPDGPWRTVV
jgi:hypothetical protein